jgi:hypothetical protein
VTIEAVRSLLMIPSPSIGRRNQGPPRANKTAL